MLSVSDKTNRTFINRLRRVAYRAGFKVIKIRESGFMLVESRDPEKIVLGADRGTGASIKEVAKFLKVAA